MGGDKREPFAANTVFFYRPSFYCAGNYCNYLLIPIIGDKIGQFDFIGRNFLYFSGGHDADIVVVTTDHVHLAHGYI